MLEMQDINKGVRYKPRTRSRMHYEDMWSTYDECKRIVMDEWGRHDGWVRNKPVQYFRKAANNSMHSCRDEVNNNSGIRKRS